MRLHEVIAGAAAAAFGCALAIGAAHAQETVTLHGASQFNEDHAFTRAMTRFQELVKEYYDGPVEFVMHLNSELGLEKQYFEYMSQGTSVDYAIVSPAHMSTFSQAAPFIDAPFLFRDLEHWNAVLEADIFKPIAEELEERAGVLLIGYAGGGTRNIFSNTEVSSLEEIQGLKVRVQGAPIWSSTFAAIGMSPTVIAYNEVYNAIQNNVINAGENEAAGVEQMKFYEVAPEPRDDPARDHDPAAVLLQGDLRPPAGGPAGGDPARRQGGGRLRPRDRVRARMRPSSRRSSRRAC